jgi:uncharacterized protein YciI
VFVILSRYLKPLDELDGVLPAHRAFLDKYYAEGLLIASGPQNPRTGGVIITADAPRERIEAMLAEDPFVRHGCAEYHVIEFSAVKHAEWFVR